MLCSMPKLQETVDIFRKTYILVYRKPNNQGSVRNYGTGCGGLSGEHIELCAEGARRKPNLSGKRTEKHERDFDAVLIIWGLYFLERRNTFCTENLLILSDLFLATIPNWLL